MYTPPHARDPGLSTTSSLPIRCGCGYVYEEAEEKFRSASKAVCAVMHIAGKIRIQNDSPHMRYMDTAESMRVERQILFPYC
jgi:hypothetical protein